MTKIAKNTVAIEITETVEATSDNEAFTPALETVEASEEKPATNLFTKQASERNEKLARKAVLLSGAKQHLAEACDFYADASKSDNVANQAASKGAETLLFSQCEGLLSKEEVNAALGDIFGYKPKSDGKPGKTPAGKGEDIRKRIVRLHNAYEYAFGRDGGTYFESLPKDEVFAVVSNAMGGDVSVWTAYEQLAEIKKNHQEKVESAFNPKTIAALVEALAKDGAQEKIKANPALIANYGALIEVLEEIGKVG